MTIETFKAQFRYVPEFTGNVGVEREAFLANEHGVIVPKAYEVLGSIRGLGIPTRNGHYELAREGEFSYELSACQIESRVGPCTLKELPKALHGSKQRLERVVRHAGLKLLHTEVGPQDMPLDIYPDPSGRYQKIAERLSKKELLAGCRVIGTHVHIGMPDHDTALKVYNQVIQQEEVLRELGNGSFGERLAIYRQMAPEYDPLYYGSWDSFYSYAKEKGFEHDPRKCWSLIRISVHGTIEFRMFGATNSVNRIVYWANRCHALCTNAMG